MGTLYSHRINEHLSFHYFIHKFMPPYFQQSSSTFPYKPTKSHNSSIRSDEGLTLEISAF